MNKKGVSGLRFTVYGLLLVACCLPFTAAAQAPQQHVTVGGNVFGGGNKAPVAQGTKVLIDQAGAVITGDVYGGGALAEVDTIRKGATPPAITTDDSILVKIMQGTINGNIYGGGLGDSIPAPYSGAANVAAHVYGPVHVYIGAMLKEVNDPTADSLAGTATIGGEVFGCNNLNGSPKSDVLVDVWQTAHTAANTYPSSITTLDDLAAASNADEKFAIKAVYGGGNMAAYTAAGKTATVHIHTCLNTIKTVYGGGNAADATNVKLIVDGGRFDQVFGGGNGYSSNGNHTDASAPNYNPGANISGTAATEIHGGLYRQLFGGSNQYGDVGSASISIDHASESCAELILESFGGANEADITGDITTNLLCSNVPVQIGSFYGGSNAADIDGDVTLNVYGGIYTNVFGGSKGRSGNTSADSANIDGNVTLNLFGGTMVNAFGGSDVNGNITGSINVNMLDFGGTCGLQVNNVFGGGRNAAYTPDDATTDSITVNIIHGTVSKVGDDHGNVYGGGYGAPAEAHAGTVVNIGYDATLMGADDDNTKLLYSLLNNPNVTATPATSPANYQAIAQGSVYGSGYAAPVDGNTTVVMTKANSSASKLFGGGANAGVTSNTYVTLTNGTVLDGIFGGSDTTGTITGNTVIALNGGYAGTNGHPANYGICGGGWGQPTRVNGNVSMTLDGTSVYGDIYGGSFYGNVNTNSSNTTVVTLTSGSVDGNVYGGGLGDKETHVVALVNGAVTVNANGATVTGNIFGSNNENGAPQSTVAVNFTGGSALGVFGGGNLADYAGTPVITVSGGTITKRVVGGGYAAGVGGSSIAISGGAIATAANEDGCGVYGGCYSDGDVSGAIAVSVTGGTVGTDATHRANIHGGGYGDETTTGGTVTVNIGATNGNVPPTYSGTAIVYGDIYGGSALGEVSATGLLTQVNVYKGTINGDIYGGGLGDNNNAALVSGNVEVNIRGGVFNAADGTAGGGMVFGANNANGTPKGDVAVNIYGTDHGNTPATNAYPTGITTASDLATNAATQTYAIAAVYGGGNLASYTPDANKSATVHVYNCNNTIKDVYGGGNAANVGTTGEGAIPANTYVVIDGGRIHRVFGGGNGEVTAANTYGTATTTVNAGLIDQIFGCGNMQGTITATNLQLLKTGSCTDEVWGEVFGGANMAVITTDLNTTIGCGVGTIGDFYGGSNKASINGDVTLNLYGGTFTNVYGGSKGIRGNGSTILDTAANITGSVTLNLYGGTIVNAFGGSNANGNIGGSITVNVLNHESTCGLNITNNIYGAGNETPYTPTLSEGVHSPVVNVIHVGSSGSIGGSVYGGAKGSTATVTADPIVNFGYDATTMASLSGVVYPDGIDRANYRAVATGNVYGGGDAAAVTGNTTVLMQKSNSQVDKLFGGGNAAGVSGTASVTLTSGTVSTGLYGGCNTTGSVGGNITVALNGGTVGVNGTTTDVVYGGGFGHNTATGGDVSVTLNGTTVYGNLYGGSALGSVNGSSSTTTVTLNSATLYGTVFGGGMGSGTESATQATTNGNVIVNHNIANSNLRGIYGGANVNGHVDGNIAVNIEANVGASGNGNRRDIYGGGLGQYTTTDGNVTVTVGNSTTPEIYGSIYGGSEKGEVGAAGKIAKVYFKTGTLHDTIFGGGKGQASPAIAAAVTGGTEVTVTTGTISGGIYGGANINGTVAQNITVNVNGGTIGADAARASVYGGGYGNNTATQGNVEVNINGATVWGDVYGGSGFGNVGNDINDAVEVNILTGEVKGDIFGGGLGSTSPAYAATEAGTVTVNIGSGTPANETGGASSVTGGAIIGGSVYGCNNTNGSPDGDVTVNIFQTAHTIGTNSFADAGYAITSVFGGGKEADYTATGKKAYVNVYTCDNTIGTLFGGGDAAEVPGTQVSIYGGRIGTVYGGGNGAVTAANVGTGGITLSLHGGTIGTLVSASNQQGTISGAINVTVDNVNGCTETVTDFFGGANMVDIGTNEHPVDVVTTIECGAGTFTNVYGGSNQANIIGNVVLNVKGGTMQNIYGGSKGVENGTAANITGNVTLNLYGGTISQDAFGGSNQNGSISGNITVNVLDHEGTCALDVNNIYGGGNVTPYAPTSPSATSPTINVMHIKQLDGIRGNVYGGGKGSTAVVTAQPRVNIGYVAASMSNLSTVEYPAGIDPTTYVAKVTGSVFGGGNAAAVNGSPIVTLDHINSEVGNLYGGGNAAGITGRTTVTMNNGRVTDGIYGGCNTDGTVTGNATVTLLGGTVGSLVAHTALVPATVTGRIFGGGYGASTNVDGQVHVIFGNSAGTATPTLIGDLYGGSALGKVNTNSTHLGGTTVNGTDSVVVDILSGTIQGTVYGGGLGRKAAAAQGEEGQLGYVPAVSAVEATVHGKVHVNIGIKNPDYDPLDQASPKYFGSADFNTYALTDSTEGGGSVYGCNNTNGSPQHNVYVDIYQCHRGENELVGDVGSTHYSLADVLGGGNAADYAPDNDDEHSDKKPYVTVHGCANTINRVFGGCNAADAVGTHVVVEGGRFNEIFGGGNGAVKAANIAPQGAHLEVMSGRVGYVFGECNRRGTVTGGVTVHAEEGDHGNPCGELIIDNHFFGGNFADVIGEKVYSMTCSENKTYTGVYGGCRLGTVYGNVTLIIEGGKFINVYAGSLGANDYAANIRKYPTLAQLQADTALGVTDEAKERWNISPYIHEEWNKPENKAFRDSAGTGGNLTLILRGGTIDNAFGGCNQNGSAEGKITVIIDDAENLECPLDVDYVYGGSNLARYRPEDPTITSPIVELRNGTVNYDVFGGGHGSADNVNAGLVTSNPLVVMGGGKRIDSVALIRQHIVKWIDDGDAHDFWVKGNIYGGGEMGSVGNFTRVDNAVTACTPNTGKTTVDIRTGTVGPDAMSADFLSGYTGDNFQRDRIVGMVFGGSKGAVGDTTTKPFYSHIAYANQTEVIIGNSDHTGPFIKGSVYGGAQSGRVYTGGTYVKIQGGQIGCGAGQSDPYSAGQFIATPATVDNTNHLAECPHWDYGRDDGNGVEHLPFDLFATNSTADARPKGSDGHTFYGNVFGGGSGYFPYASGKWIRSAGQVFGRTKVEITGGHILTSIYGGNELTDVTGDSCVVIMSGGTLGVPRTLTEIANHPVTCYLFGAGKGDERVHFNKWTNVQNTRVTVSGDAHIYGSIFGGGEDGHVMHNAKVVFDVDRNGVLGTTGTSYVDGNIFGGGRGFKGEAMTAGNVADRDTVIIRQGTILGSVYGGGRLGSVGYDLCNTNEECYGKMSADANRGHIVVTITGGIIGNDVASDYNLDHSRGGNVYGGSMGRLTKLDGSYALALWHGLGSAKSTKVTISGDTTWIKGNVYGGSELGTVTENIQVNISGNVTVGRKTAGTTAHGNVYGGGVGQAELTAAERTQVGNDATSDSIPTFAGLTGGTIQVNISGGAINNNVYGAGELASVGTIATVTKHTDKATTYFLSWPYEYTYNGNSGEAQVNITGGTIGFISGGDTTGGNIYGSARGIVGDRYVTGRLSTARRTQVNINLASNSDKIIGDVYGSGENGHVYESATVTLTNGLVLGNVFGGGKGVDKYTDQLKRADESTYDTLVYDIIAGKVFGNTEVNILGGRVAKNVYGGGNLASVGIGNYKVYGEATGNISSADSLLAENSGHCYVNILGGVIGPDSIINGTRYNGNYAVTTGHVYGAGKGIVFPTAKKVGFDYDRDYYVAYVNKTFVIIGDSNNRSCQYTSSDPHVTGIVFGGGENGHVRFDTYVQTNRGQIGVRPLDATGDLTSDVGHWANRGNIFGAGRGEDKLPNGKYCQSAGSVTRNTRIDVLGARIYRNVQGGGAMASVGPIKGRGGDSSTCVINVRLPLDGDTLGGPSNTHNAFGGYVGGGSRGIPSPDGTRNDSLATCHNSQINIYRGRLKNTIYGGGENGQMLGNTQVNVYGGYVRSAIYGGGKGSWKETEYNDGHDYTDDTLSGYVYGNTEVNLLGGTVPYTYGGCRRASVGGNATINIGKDNGDGTYDGNVSFQSSKRKVYGGNQYAGSPRGNIYVNVYKTAHTAKDAAVYTEADATYAIGHVYGGSYNSPYLPNKSGRYAQVHIYGCDNTIGEVYGGCAAADAGAKPGIGASTKLIIDGGRFNKVFGGGDGTFDRYIGTPVPANVYGTAFTKIHGGKIGSLFGGSNFMGQADTISISVDNESGCGNVEGDEFFGGSNLSNLGPTVLSTTLGCGVRFNAAYGGSNQADITGDVTLIIEGGEFNEVYGGSKGAIVAASASAGMKDTVKSDIRGNTHLILRGGTVGNAFGGSNINGNITGTITVDVDSTYNTNECPWNVDYVYGGSNLTQYLPDDSTVTNHSPSPLVNILCGTVNNDVYGGGKGDSDVDTAGLVQSNPQVVMSQTNKGNTWVKGSIYGGGSIAITDGNTEVNISAGTVGVRGSATTNGNVYGGGRGDASKIKAGLVKRNSTVNIAGGRVWHNVYGGGSLASVGTFTYGAVDRSTKSQQITSCAEGTGLATVYISGGIIGNDGHENGMVFGSSRGDIDTILARMDTMAWAYATRVTIGDTTADHTMTTPEIKGSVYGGGENGHVKQDAYVHIYSGQVGYQSDRADDNTKNIDKSDPTYAFRGNVYGAGCGTDKFFIKDSIAQLKIHGTINHLEKGGGYHSPTDVDHSKDSIFKVYDYNMYAGVVQGNTHVKISGGHIFHNVYGGGAMANVGTISSLVQYKDMFADGSAHKFGLSYPNHFTFVEPTGYVHIDITGGRIGTMGSYDGDVYGGARGEAGDRFKMARYGNVRTAVININMPTVDAAYALDTFDVHECITGSVYGGAENGHINDSTFVTLTNGLVGHALYGGGKGKGEYITHELNYQKNNADGHLAGDDSTATIFSLTAGKVYGNTRVVMNGGHVVRNIYGGGNQGSVGKGNYHGGSGDYCSAGYGERLEAGDTAVWLPLFRSSGTSTVIVNGGTVGLADATIKDSLPYGNVFGGCRGTAAPNVRQTLSPRVIYYPIFFAGYTNRTRVIIGDGTTTPRIYGSVYGGGMDGHVRWGTHVTVKSGEIGLAYNAANQTAVGTDNLDSKQWLLRGSVYGAGSGMGQYEATLKHTTERAGEGGWAVGDDSVGYLYSSSAGSVTHFTRVDIEGGIIHNNVYGGGSLASVGPPMMGQRHNAPIDSSLSVINISGGTIGTFADVVGYKVIHHDAVPAEGTEGEEGYVAPVAAYDETVHYSYGGKVFGGSRGQIDVDNASFSTVVWTQVNLSGGQAYGSVYGGGEVGTIKEDAYVNVSGGIVGPNVAVKTTGPGGDSLSCVYGGGKGIGDDPSSTYSTFTNVNNTHVAVSGGRVCGSVFGGAEDGHVLGNTNVSISNTVAGSTVQSIPIIGTGGYTHEYDGCVLGGGRNALNKNASAGRVQGNTHVTVTGGRIMRTILGGGALARVGVNVDGVFKGIGAGNDTISFKDNSGNYDSINHGTTFVHVEGTYDDVAANTITKEHPFYGTTVDLGGGRVRLYHTAIGAPGDTSILVDNDYTIGDIFGGGKGDTKDTLDIMAGRVMNTYVTITGSPRIMADIYAGAEMASVGWWDTNRYVGTYGASDPNPNHDKYYDHTGYTHVTIYDSPYTGTPYEFSTKNYIQNRRAWTLIDSLGRLTHTCSGNVYGGGQGYVEEDATHRHNWVHMGRVRHTNVVINGGSFMGNVFGGGSRGVVKEHCYVTITGGHIGCVIHDESKVGGKAKYRNNEYYYGSVFGGGYGNPKNFLHVNDSSFVTSGGKVLKMRPTEQAGRVYGNTRLKITGGHIMDCVYGGGDLASTGYVERDPATGNFYFDNPAKRHGGVCNVDISGNTVVGPLDYFGHNAYVYAAGRGVGYDPDGENKTYCNVNEAHLTVHLREGAAADLPSKRPNQWDTTTMGGRIWGSLFGGGSDCHVLGDVSTTVHSGIVGTQGTTSYDGNIFGGGRNYLSVNHTNGRVQGNIRVFVDGGTLQGSIFGGGRMALSGVDSVGHFIDKDHGNVCIHVLGKVVIGNSNSDSLLWADESCGDIFGAGKGDTKNYKDVWAGRVTNARIIVKDSSTGSPRIYGSVFGGGEMASLGYWDDTITDGEGHVIFHTDGTGGTDYGVMYANTGNAVINLSGNLTVGSALEYTVAPYANPGDWTIYESTADDTTLVHTCTGNVFGGSQGDVDPSAPRWVSMGRSASSVVNISGGTYYGDVYGGSEQGIVTGDTRLNISGGTFGYTGQEGAINGHLTKVYTGDIYAAGYGSDDPSDNAVPYVYEDENGDEQTIANPYNDSTAASIALGIGWTPDVLAGRTFGNARVDITGGTIHGSVYGGGSFASVGDDKSTGTNATTETYPIYGVTTVNIGLPGVEEDGSDATGNATIRGEVFGGNNFSGTPYGNTNVHIYKTAHTAGTPLEHESTTIVTGNQYPSGLKAVAAPTDALDADDMMALSNPERTSLVASDRFALKAVYGGGNKAAHTPLASDGTTLVHVHYCDMNTIGDVYGGGNAANTNNNHIVIDGGYINRVFGGGNGEVTPADVSGTALTEIRGGIITEAYGGSNNQGTIGFTDLRIDQSSGCEQLIGSAYGGGNNADAGSGEVTIECGASFDNFYAGGSKASLGSPENPVDMILNIKGGTFVNLFGGCKGDTAILGPGHINMAANIYGNVTVNVYGGNIQNLYGGSDVNGNITGSITVNVDIDPDYDCEDGLRLDNVYGAGRDAAYTPYDPYRGSPTVNIMNNLHHVSGSTGTMADSAFVEIIDVFGGGFGATATTTSYPRVIIGGFEDGSKTVNETPVTYHRAARIFGNAYGGGSMAPVKGNTYVLVRDAVIGRDDEVESFSSGNLFGGGYGSTSKVMGDTYVGVFGLSDIKSNVYGGGNAGIVTGNTEVVVGYQKQVIVPELIAYADTINKGQPNQQVKIMAGFHSATPGVRFRYTTNGTTPTTTTGTLYTDDILSDGHNKANDFEIDWPDEIQMIAYLWDEVHDEVDSTMIPSIVGFDRSTSPIITFKDGKATFDGTVGARVYYTLDGSQPTTSSTLWATIGESEGSPSPVTIASTDVVKAFSVQRGCFDSEVSFLTADAPTVDNGTNTNIFTITAKPGERIIYTLGTTDIPTPISLMNQGQRPGQGPGETGMEESTDDAPGHTATASDGSTVTHKKRVYTNSKGETVTYRWSEVTAASSGNTTVTITVPSDGHDYTVKAIVEHAGYAPSPISAAVYQP